MDKSKSQLWKFNFVLEKENGEEIAIDIPSDLLERIIEWVEQNGCQIGGGFSPIDDNSLDIKDFKFEYQKKNTLNSEKPYP